MAKVFVITGTPGVGKTYVSKAIAKKIKSCQVINVNEIAKKEGYLQGKGPFGENIVNMRKLEKLLNALARRSKYTYVIM